MTTRFAPAFNSLDPSWSPPSVVEEPLLKEITKGDLCPPQCDCSQSWTYNDTEIICTGHELCEHEAPSRVCLTCLRRYCLTCFDNVHKNPVLSGCHTLSYTSYCNIRDMFHSFGVLNNQGMVSMPLSQILDQSKKFLSKHSSLQRLRQTVKRLATQHESKSYQITFIALLREYSSPLSYALSYQSNQVSNAVNFHQLNRCGRCLFRWSHRHWNLPDIFGLQLLLQKLRVRRGDYVYFAFKLVYTLFYINLMGLFCYLTLLVVPWVISPTLRHFVSSYNRFIQWQGFASGGIGLDFLPIVYGGFPDASTVSADSDNSAHWYVLFFPLFMFISLALGTIFVVYLVLFTQRDALTADSTATMGPNLLGPISAPVLMGFSHNHSRHHSHMLQSQQELLMRIRMAYVRKYSSDQTNSLWSKFRQHNLFWALLSLLSVPIVCVALYCVDRYGLGTTSGPKDLQVTPHLQVLLFPAIFYVVQWIHSNFIEYCVRKEVPSRIQFFARFRTTLFYRFAYFDLLYLIILIVLSYYHQHDAQPYVWSSITIERQRALGYCDALPSDGETRTSLAACSCPQTAIGMFWFRFLITGAYWEIVLFILATFKAMVRFAWTNCFRLELSVNEPNIPSHFFSIHDLFGPLPWLRRMFWMQYLCWASVLYLPGGIALVTLFHFCSILLASIQALFYNDVKARYVYLLQSKITTYVPTFILLATSYIPSAIFLSSEPHCGPFVDSLYYKRSAYAHFIDFTVDFPVVIQQVFQYFNNALVLWVVFLGVVAYTLVSWNMIRSYRKTRGHLLMSLRLASAERLTFLKSLGSNLQLPNSRGERLFVDWMLEVLKEDYSIHPPLTVDPGIDTSKEATPSPPAYVADSVIEEGSNERDSVSMRHSRGTPSRTDSPSTAATPAVQVSGLGTLARSALGYIDLFGLSPPTKALDKKLLHSYLMRIQHIQPNLLELAQYNEEELYFLFTTQASCPEHIAHMLVKSFNGFCSRLLLYQGNSKNKPFI